jgi:hypothetical protein
MSEANKNQTVFKTLSAVNVSMITKDKGGKTYLSWAHAWEEVKKKFDDVSYEIKEFNGLPYIYDENAGYMIFTSVTIKGETHPMWLPVMDGANNAMKKDRYFYEVKEWVNRKPTGNMIKKWVEPATMFDINKAIMRCLVKNLPMFGLGLYIYQGEDIPTVYQIDSIDLVGLTVLQLFNKYNIHVVKASKILQETSATPFVDMPCFETLNDEQKIYMERPEVIQWLANVAGK